jgi:HKD family nuclease
MMKFHKYLLVFSLSLSFTNFYGMKRERSESPPIQNLTVKTLFVPQDQDVIKSELFSLLDKAKKQVLVAMYWLTDNAVIDRLISLRQKGVDVRVIIDEDSQLYDALINKLLKGNITFFIYPSKIIMKKMHNKFLVVDNLEVFTGSANLTGAALTSNYENVVIFNSPEIAQKYVSNFQSIEHDTLDSYVSMVAQNEPGQLPQWAKRLFRWLPLQELLSQTARALMLTYDLTGQERLRIFFNLPEEVRQPAQEQLGFSSSEESDESSGSEESLTPSQEIFLQDHGYRTKGMSYERALQLIGDIERGRATPPMSRQPESSKRRDIGL